MRNIGYRDGIKSRGVKTWMALQMWCSGNIGDRCMCTWALKRVWWCVTGTGHRPEERRRVLHRRTRWARHLAEGRWWERGRRRVMNLRDTIGTRPNVTKTHASEAAPCSCLTTPRTCSDQPAIAYSFTHSYSCKSWQTATKHNQIMRYMG